MYSPTPSSKEAEQRKLAMAGDLDGGEFWLPPQFLTEEEILMGFDTNSSAGFNSELGSPVDSVTETESDDDEFVSGLTRHMALSSLLPDSPNNNITNPKGWVLSGSPQSTLCPVGGGGISSRGRPTGRTSPPAVSDAGVSAKKGTGYFDSSIRGKQSTPVSALNSQNPDFQVSIRYFSVISICFLSNRFFCINFGVFAVSTAVESRTDEPTEKGTKILSVDGSAGVHVACRAKPSKPETASGGAESVRFRDESGFSGLDRVQEGERRNRRVLAEKREPGRAPQENQQEELLCDGSGAGESGPSSEKHQRSKNCVSIQASRFKWR